MSFDAFCFSPSDGGDIPGETQDKDFSAKKAFEILSFELGAENNINIGSISGGGGAGKATFKEFTITKKTDTASTGLFHALVTGKHFTDLEIHLRRSSGEAAKSGKPFLVFKFAFVMVQDISWSGSDGDDICEETVIFQFGAIRVEYSKQLATGAMESPKVAQWSRVTNEATMDV
ncbi:MAG: type VI secretion system tube protein Hcp [Paracoccaceae bacterium]